MLSEWATFSKQITSKHSVDLTPELEKYIKEFDFSIFHAKQPIEILAEHSKTSFHLMVFGAPLIEQDHQLGPHHLWLPLKLYILNNSFQLSALISKPTCEI